MWLGLPRALRPVELEGRARLSYFRRLGFESPCRLHFAGEISLVRAWCATPGWDGFDPRHLLHFIRPPTGPLSQRLPSSLRRCAPSFVSPDADGPSSALDPVGRIIGPPTGPLSQRLPSSLRRCAPSFVSPDADGPSSALDPVGRMIGPPTGPLSQRRPCWASRAHCL